MTDHATIVPAGEPFPLGVTISPTLDALATSGPITTGDISVLAHDVDRAIIEVSADRLGIHHAPSSIPGESRTYLTIAPVLPGLPIVTLLVSDSSIPWRESALRLIEHAATDEFTGSASLVVWPSSPGCWVVMSAVYTDSEGERHS